MKRWIIKTFFADAIKSSRSPTISKNGTVLLLGWAGAKQRQLNRLNANYNRLGISTVTLIMPLIVPLFIRDWLERDALVLLDEIMKAEKQDKVVVHSYSNNGIWVYSSLIKSGILKPPVALIVDAAPYLWYEVRNPWTEAGTLSRVVTAMILNKDIYEHWFITPFLHGIFYIGSHMNNLLVSYQGNFRLSYDAIAHNKFMRDKSPAVPTLFIYSNGDKLVPPDVVREFIEELRKRGYDSEEIIFGDNVGHVASYYSDPVLYMNSVQKFLKRVI